MKLKIGKTSALIIALLLASIASSVTAAVVYTLTKPATITIISNANANSTYMLGVYSNSNCTQEITTIDLGECLVGSGITDNIWVYVKNLGDTTVSVSLRNDLNYTIGYFTYDYFNNVIAPGESTGFHMQFYANENATAGTYSFNIYIDAVA